MPVLILAKKKKDTFFVVKKKKFLPGSNIRVMCETVGAKLALGIQLPGKKVLFGLI